MKTLNVHDSAHESSASERHGYGRYQTYANFLKGEEKEQYEKYMANKRMLKEQREENVAAIVRKGTLAAGDFTRKPTIYAGDMSSPAFGKSKKDERRLSSLKPETKAVSQLKN